MSRQHHVLVLTLLLVAVGSVPAFASGNASFLTGGRSTSHDFWGQKDDQGVGGVMVDFGKDNWPIHLCLSTMSSGSDKGPGSAGLSEYAVGIMKIWEVRKGGIFRPYAGAGVAAVSAAFVTDLGGNEDLVQHDGAGALYADGGVLWRTGKRFNIGAGVRFLISDDIQIGNATGDADYVQFHVLAGFGWPRRQKAAPLPPPPPNP
jgi:opacity protein-like surface antigen